MEFLKQDNIVGIRKQLKLLFNAFSVEPHPVFPFLCSHPFTESMHCYINSPEGAKFLDLNKEEDLSQWKAWIFQRIDNINSLSDIIYHISKPYRLTILKYCRAYLSIKTFSNLLSSCWIASENPNGDVNCSLAELAGWFRAADKRYLMNKEEYAVWKNFPDEFTIYRGVAVGRKPYGLSWTDNYDVAEWFAHRYDTDLEEGYIQKAVIKKEWALAYLKSRGEYEVVADVAKFRKQIERI